MQTFLPYPSANLSAAVLDDRRLGKQRVENLQIMSALIDPKAGWANHPAVKMWKGYEHYFLFYQEAICREWHLVRGFEDTCLRKTTELFWTKAPYLANEEGPFPPWWMGDKIFHLSHQSNLVRKDAERYGKIFQGVSPDIPYRWPTADGFA